MTTMVSGRLTVTQQELDELIGTPHLRASSTGLTTGRWPLESTIICVPVHAVMPTQRVKAEWVNEYLAQPQRDSHCGDVFGHVVVDRGCWLIEDGHHRWAAAVVAGKQWWPARVFVLSLSSSGDARQLRGQ